MKKLLARATALLLTLLVLQGRSRAYAATYEDTFYLLPITDGVSIRPQEFGFSTAVEVIDDLRTRLGEGGPYAKTGFSEVYRYMTETYSVDQDYQINPNHLNKIFQLAIDTNSPFLIHLNGFQWGGCGPLMQMFTQNPKIVMWDQQSQPWLGCQSSDINLSLNKDNALFRYYKKRNLQATARKIAEFRNGPHGHLLVGVSTDAEIAMNSWHAVEQGKRFDYNPQMLCQYKEETGQDGWPSPTDSVWIDFKIGVIDQTLEEITAWINEAGLPKERIYTHQMGFVEGDTIGLQIYNAPLTTAQVKRGSLGITTYGDDCFSKDLFQQARELDPNWGIFEHNPLSSDDAQNYKALNRAYTYGAHIITPFHWVRPLSWVGEYPYAIRGRSFERAIKNFINDKKNTPRPVPENNPPPFSPVCSDYRGPCGGQLRLNQTSCGLGDFCSANERPTGQICRDELGNWSSCTNFHCVTDPSCSSATVWTGYPYCRSGQGTIGSDYGTSQDCYSTQDEWCRCCFAYNSDVEQCASQCETSPTAPTCHNLTLSQSTATAGELIDLSITSTNGQQRDLWLRRCTHFADDTCSKWESWVKKDTFYTDDYAEFQLPEEAGYYDIGVDVLNPDCTNVCSSNGKNYNIEDCDYSGLTDADSVCGGCRAFITIKPQGDLNNEVHLKPGWNQLPASSALTRNISELPLECTTIVRKENSWFKSPAGNYGEIYYLRCLRPTTWILNHN